jgi:hypothetical protein
MKAIHRVVATLLQSKRGHRRVGVELNRKQMVAVAGGLPKGGWGSLETVEAHSLMLALPKGGW